MAKPTKPIEPHQFIRNSPSRPLAQADVREFVLENDFPPPWGASMEAHLTSHLAALGFQKIWCQCQEVHTIVRIRMNCGVGEPRPVAELKRLLRKVARALGSPVSRGGMNVWVRRDRIEAAIVMEQPAG